MASSSSASTISFRERVYIRHITVLSKRTGKNVDRAAVDNAIIEANDGDKAAATSAKYYCARNTVKFCFHRPSNQYFFVPHAFGTKIIRKGLPHDTFSQLVGHLDYVEENETKKNMSETQHESDNPMWYLDHTTGVVADVCQIIASEFRRFEEKERVRDVFVEFMELEKISALATHIV